MATKKARSLAVHPTQKTFTAPLGSSLKSLAFSSTGMGHWHLEVLEIGLLLTDRHFAEHATRFWMLTSLRFRGLRIGEPLARFACVGGQRMRTAMNFVSQESKVSQ